MANLAGKTIIGQSGHRYHVDEFIDSGGMAEVYRVTDLQMGQGVPLAMKVLKEDLMEDEQFLRWFQREAKNLAKLQHPNIVRLYRLDWSGRLAFMILDYIKGHTLKDILDGQKSRPMEPARILEIMEPVSHALHYAHLADRAHCDIKPSNIMQDEHGKIYLSDFGIMQQVGSVTTTMAGAGTPAYMAPEMIRQEDVSPATDIYSLAIVLFEMLTGGRRPFNGDQAQLSGTTTRAEKIRWEQLNVDPPPPSQFNRRISREMDALVLKCLAKDPLQRCQDMDQFMAELRTTLGMGAPVQRPKHISPPAGIRANTERPAAGKPPLAGREVTREPNMAEPVRPGRQRSFNQKWLLAIPAVLLLVILLFWFLSQTGREPPAATTTAAALGIPTASQPAAAANEEIKLALLAPLTGPVPTFGVSTRDGFLMAVDEANAKGGVLGRKVVTVIEDSKCTADPAVKAANKVINEDGVHYIIGEVCSPASIPVADITQAKHVVQISPTSTMEQVTLKSDGTAKEYVFRACFIDPFQGTVMARFALSRDYRTAFVMKDPSNSYASSLAESFSSAFTAGGGKVVGSADYSGNATDFSSILTRIANSGARMVYLPDYYNLVNLVIAQAKSRGIRAIFMGGDGWDSSELDLKAAEGGYYSNHYSPEDSRPIVVDFVKRYRARFGSTPDALAVLAYDSANLMMAAIAKAGVDDPQKVKDALAGVNFDAVTGNIRFDKYHNPIKDVVILQVRNGRLDYVTTIAP